MSTDVRAPRDPSILFNAGSRAVFLGRVSADSSDGERSKRGVLAEGHPGPAEEDTASLSLPQP